MVFCSQEGTWLWSDGSKLNIEIWAPEQPDNYNGKENCLGMNQYRECFKFYEISSLFLSFLLVNP